MSKTWNNGWLEPGVTVYQDYQRTRAIESYTEDWIRFQSNRRDDILTPTGNFKTDHAIAAADLRDIDEMEKALTEKLDSIPRPKSVFNTFLEEYVCEHARSVSDKVVLGNHRHFVYLFTYTRFLKRLKSTFKDLLEDNNDHTPRAENDIQCAIHEVTATHDAALCLVSRHPGWGPWVFMVGQWLRPYPEESYFDLTSRLVGKQPVSLSSNLVSLLLAATECISEAQRKLREKPKGNVVDMRGVMKKADSMFHSIAKNATLMMSVTGTSQADGQKISDVDLSGKMGVPYREVYKCFMEIYEECAEVIRHLDDYCSNYTGDDVDSVALVVAETKDWMNNWIKPVNNTIDGMGLPLFE